MVAFLTRVNDLKNLIKISVLFLSLTACVDTSAYQAAIAQKGAVAADNELDAVVWAMCKASPAGAVMRRFGGSTELWNAFITVCWREPMAAADKPPLP